MTREMNLPNKEIPALPVTVASISTTSISRHGKICGGKKKRARQLDLKLDFKTEILKIHLENVTSGSFSAGQNMSGLISIL